MQLDRRDVIKGLCLAGISGMMPARIAAGMQPVEQCRASTLHLLVAGSHQDNAFLDGAFRASRSSGARCAIVRLKSPLYEDPAQLNGFIEARPSVIALVSPSDGIILQELARGAGMRLSFIGHHHVSSSHAAHRHYFTTFEQAGGPRSTVSRGVGSENTWAALLAESLAQIAGGAEPRSAPGRWAVRLSGERSPQKPEELTSLLIQA